MLELIRWHDIYDWDNPREKTIEFQILQDADNLDAIGAIGIARAFAFGGAHDSDMYIPGENHDFTEAFVDDPKHKTSIIAHFYEKLLKLKENMNTETGKALAHERHQFMEIFLQQFHAEWNGEK